MGALLGAHVALGAALPAEANQLAQHSAASPEIQEVHDSANGALYLGLTLNEALSTVIGAVMGAGVEMFKTGVKYHLEGKPEKHDQRKKDHDERTIRIDYSQPRPMTEAERKRFMAFADATVHAVLCISEGGVTEKVTEKLFPAGHHVPLTPTPTSASQCDCSPQALALEYVRVDMNSGKTDDGLECLHRCTREHKKCFLDLFPPELRAEKATQLSHFRNLVRSGLAEKAFQNVYDAPTNRIPKELDMKHASHSKRSEAQESFEAKTPAFPPPTLTKTAQCDCTKLLTIACGDQDHYSVQKVYGQKCVDECTKKLDDKLQKDFQIQDYPSPKQFMSNKTASRQMSPDCPKMLLDSFTDPEHKTAGTYDAKCILGCRSVLQEKLDKGVVDVKPWKQHHHDEVAPPTSLTKRGGRDEAEYDDERQKGMDDEYWQRSFFTLEPKNPTVDTMFGKKECHCKELSSAAQTRYESITHHDSKYHRFKTKVWYRHNKKCLEGCHSAAKQGLGLTDEDLNPDNRPPLQ